MKTMVAYMTVSGRTEIIAKAIYKEITGEKEIKEIDEIENLDDYDFVFVGFPMHGFAAPEETEAFLKKYCQGKQVALFVTHGAPESFEGLDQWLEKCKDAAVGAEVLDMFNCQGELAQDVIDELLKSDDPEVRSWGEAGPSTVGQPDAQRVESAREFARKVMAKIQK